MTEHTCTSPARDFTGAAWFTSSYSAGEGNCVGAAVNLPGIVPVRDTKAPEAGTLAFNSDTWTAFTASLKY
ncbi:DUF397 domain-containing protein [Streptomyces sp. BE147]|uniref:DUF397 domain-containing protein n=1 Tax=unclassified Streptomyces TaxID=2593676 RepID=UPI002E790152|nr:DUF397 domain-containing protein [Streptomyces sp. BE147]MEE1737005.1 DUF397 domain-containing protein [Streptomyces sp. BE147]